MKILHLLVRPVALLPLLAVGAWTSLASRLPEPLADRQALGEVTMRLDIVEWNMFVAEPAHPVPRTIGLLLLNLPGSAMQYLTIANALLAVAVVFALAALLRRTFALGAPGQALALGTAGLFACSPAFGANWLHGERVGIFLPPLLLLGGLHLLQRDGRLWWRGLLALLFAALAPFCHGTGQLVAFALLPAFVEAARRASGARTVAWVTSALIVGNIAAAISMLPAEKIALDGTGLLGHFVAAPLAALQHFAAATGGAWLDPLPASGIDEVLLGAASWLAPFLLWRLGDRSDAARRAAAPWWGCLWFGLLLFVWLGERHGPQLAAALQRELAFGAFLLPTGVVGVIAARVPASVLPVAAGAALLLGAQDWHRGLEALRLATMKVQLREAAVLLPDVHSTSRPIAVLPIQPDLWVELERRGWVPLALETRLQPGIAFDAAAAPSFGSCHGGDRQTIRGAARSSVFGGGVSCVLVVVQPAGGEAVVAGRTQPDYAGRDRDVEWAVALDAPLAEGARVRAIGLRSRHKETVALGPTYILRDGVLVAVP